MLRSVLLYLLFLSLPICLAAQSSFEELVDHSFGIDQGLVNGIQFSNQYILIEGNPYFVSEGYNVGSVCINNTWYDYVPMRYNLYTQKVEIQYLSREGHMNQLITVPEKMSAFLLHGYEFRRMQIKKENPSYYMVLSSAETDCFVEWRINALGGGSSQRRFGPMKRTYWISVDEEYVAFDNRKSYLQAFPSERKKEFKKLVKSRKFYFQMATASELEEFIVAALSLYEKGVGP